MLRRRTLGGVLSCRRRGAQRHGDDGVQFVRDELRRTASLWLLLRSRLHGERDDRRFGYGNQRQMRRGPVHDVVTVSRSVLPTLGVVFARAFAARRSRAPGAIDFFTQLVWTGPSTVALPTVDEPDWQPRCRYVADFAKLAFVHQLTSTRHLESKQ